MKNNKLNLRFLLVLLSFCIFANFFGLTSIPVYADEFSSITNSTITYTDYTIGADPAGLNVTYYSDIYSRGFAWMTDVTITATELYIKEGNTTSFDASDKVEEENCTYTEITDSKATSYKYIQHKAYVENLTPGNIYSYKVGAPNHYKTGSFIVETSSNSITNIDILTLTDAQTRKGSLLSIWENTVAAGFYTLSNPDFILYDGDQFDATMNTPTEANDISYAYRYGFAKDTIASYLGSTPYMASMGNHDYYTADSKSTILCGDGTTTSMYYSFDYGFAHFAVLNCNGNGSCYGYSQNYVAKEIIDEQKIWLDNDLKTAKANSNIKWIIVMMHCGPASTGDHSAEVYTLNTAAEFTEIISGNHVDLVIQGHDHTYSKTLPYKWDTVGKTTTYGNTDIVNYSVNTITTNNTTYDLNPNGTYYVTTGASGHRAGITAGEVDGVYADVTVDANAVNGSGLAAVNSNKTYLNNTYKTIVGSCNVGCTTGTTTVNKGDPATSNIDGQMFGTLSLTEDTLEYTFYTVSGASVQVLDTLNVMKVSTDEASILISNEGTDNATNIKTLLSNVIDTLFNLADFIVEKLRVLVDSISTIFETDRETTIDSATSGQFVKVQLQSVQASAAENDQFNIRLIAGTNDTKENISTVGFKIYKWNETAYGEANTLECEEVYSIKVDSDVTNGFDNEKTVADMDGGNLFALTINNITATGNIKLKVIPYGINKDDAEVLGKSFIVEIQDGFIKSVMAE